MTYNAKKLIPTLPRGDRLSDDLEVLVQDVEPTARVNEDGHLEISAEDGKDLADYYGEFRGGYPWIHPRLETWAKRLGFHWEWQHPGAIVLTD